LIKQIVELKCKYKLNIITLYVSYQLNISFNFHFRFWQECEVDRLKHTKRQNLIKIFRKCPNKNKQLISVQCKEIITKSKSKEKNTTKLKRTTNKICTSKSQYNIGKNCTKLI